MFEQLKEGTPILNVSDCPDLGPVLFAIAAAKNGGVFSGTSRLKIKESDRGSVMARELRKFGASARVYDDEIVIYPAGFHAPDEPLLGYNDHRVVMAEAVLLVGAVVMEGIYYFLGWRVFSDLAFHTQGFKPAIALPLVCLLFVYLLLCIQYESYILPLAVLLSLPFGLCGTFIFARMMGLSNNIYLQISFIMLVGLLAKNAILIIQFAVQRREHGMSIAWAAVAGAAARFRPILMTSLAMIIGLLPLMFATGAGSNGNRTIGAGAVGGMLIGMICQIFIVPVLFVIFQTLQEKVKPLKPASPEREPLVNHQLAVENETEDSKYFL